MRLSDIAQVNSHGLSPGRRLSRRQIGPAPVLTKYNLVPQSFATTAQRNKA